MEQNNLDPFKIFIKKLETYFIYHLARMYWAHFSALDVTLIANEAHLVPARHPGDSFPVCQPWEAVPKSTNNGLCPSLPWSTSFCGP